MQIYFIPGLGADKRMYTRQLEVFPNALVLEHIMPEQDEELSAYTRRLAEGINTSSPFILVGTSLGGIFAMELSRFLSPEKIILVASVKNRLEMPLFVRAMKYLKLHRIISGDGYKRFNKLAARRLDSCNDSEAAAIIMAMMNDISSEFIEWAINAVVNWQPPVEYRADIIHIHGTNDQLFPISKIKNAIPVVNGSHVMNMTASDEVNRLLLQTVYGK